MPANTADIVAVSPAVNGFRVVFIWALLVGAPTVARDPSEHVSRNYP